jgi:hypothetical protein
MFTLGVLLYTVGGGRRGLNWQSETVAASFAADSSITVQFISHAVVVLLRPLLEHLLDGFLHHLLVLVAVVAQCVLGNTSPHQGLGLCVI